MQLSPRLARRAVIILKVEQLEDRTTPSTVAASLFDGLTVDAANYSPTDLIVALRPGTVNLNLAAVAPNVVHGTATLDAGAGLVRVDLQSGVSVAQAAAYFQLQSYVRYASPDYIVSAQVIPNDPSFSSQWGLNNTGQTGGVADADIDAPEAWSVATGSGNTVVAIIDTGMDLTHPDLVHNLWTNPGEISGNGIDDDHNGFVDDVHGWNFVSNNNNPNDDNGHGSHVAGIIGAEGNNGIGVSGVNWHVKMMPVKFLDVNGSGSLSNAVLALNYAVNNGAKISNNSWGGGGYYQPMFDALNNARTQGHIFVAAAGNASSNNDTTASYPSNYNLNNVVAVASTTSTDALSSFSNYGATTVELGAPGSSIYSTYKNGGYATLSGTSMATPFVTGAMALVKDMHPTWTYRQIIDQVVNNTDPIAALAGKTISGGRLNLYKALTAGQNDTTAPTVTAASFSGAATGTFDKLRVTFSEAINATTFATADVGALTLNGTAITGLTYTVTPVSGTNNQFDISFAAQSTVGTYAMTIGPAIADLAGNNMSAAYTATGSLSATTTTTFNSVDVPKTIADVATTTSVLTVGQGLTISKITVKLNLNHTYDSDLKISLRSPAGTTVLLANRRGGSGDNYTNTVFDSSAAISIASGLAPFGGTYRPEQLLTSFNGQNALGTWSLIIQDVAFLDSGRLNSWSITITSNPGGSSIEEPSAPDAGRGFATKLDAVIGAGFASQAPLAETAHSTVSSPAALHADSPLFDRAFAVRLSAADAGFVVTGGTHADAAAAADWLNFDTTELADAVADMIDVV